MLSTAHTTWPMLCPSLKTEVVLAPDQLEATAWETEEGDVGADGGRGFSLLLLNNKPTVLKSLQVRTLLKLKFRSYFDVADVTSRGFWDWTEQEDSLH